MADVGNLLVGIGAVGAVIISAIGLKMRDTGDDQASYWRRRALDCEAERDEVPGPRARRRRKEPR